MGEVAPRGAEVDEEADGEHGGPGADVDEALEEGAEGRGACDAEGVEGEARGHAEDAELVRAEEHVAQAPEAAGLPEAAGGFHMVVLGDGKDDDAEEEVLDGCDELGVGEALLVVEDEGADAA